MQHFTRILPILLFVLFSCNPPKSSGDTEDENETATLESQEIAATQPETAEVAKPTQLIKEPQPTIKMESGSFFLGKWKKTAGAYLDQNIYLIIQPGEGGLGLSAEFKDEFYVEFDTEKGHIVGQYSGGTLAIRAISEEPSIISLSDDGQKGHYEPIANEEYTKMADLLMGTILRIDDTGIYGLWNVEIAGDNGNMSLNYEIETPDIDGLVNSYRRILYTTTQETQVMDIKTNGNSIYGDRDDIPNLREFTGTLSNAQYQSGDTPDMITITDENGISMSTEIFITEKEIALNGQVISALYRVMGDRKVITDIE